MFGQNENSPSHLKPAYLLLTLPFYIRTYPRLRRPRLIHSLIYSLVVCGF